jgi:hypothetical protein
LSPFLAEEGLFTLSIDTSKLVLNGEVSDEKESLNDIDVGRTSFFFGG